MPRDRKQYNKDMTKHKIAYRTAPALFRSQHGIFHKKSVQQETVLTPIPSEEKPRD